MKKVPLAVAVAIAIVIVFPSPAARADSLPPQGEQGFFGDVGPLSPANCQWEEWRLGKISGVDWQEPEKGWAGVTFRWKALPFRFMEEKTVFKPPGVWNLQSSLDLDHEFWVKVEAGFDKLTTVYYCRR